MLLRGDRGLSPWLTAPDLSPKLHDTTYKHWRGKYDEAASCWLRTDCVRTKKKNRNPTKSNRALQSHHPKHSSSATATISRRCASRQVPHVSPRSPASIYIPGWWKSTKYSSIPRWWNSAKFSSIPGWWKSATYSSIPGWWNSAKFSPIPGWWKSTEYSSIPGWWKSAKYSLIPGWWNSAKFSSSPGWWKSAKYSSIPG